MATDRTTILSQTKIFITAIYNLALILHLARPNAIMLNFIYRKLKQLEAWIEGHDDEHKSWKWKTNT